MSDPVLRKAANDDAMSAAKFYIQHCWWDALDGHGADSKNIGKRWFVQLQSKQHLIVMYPGQVNTLQMILPEPVTDADALRLVQEVLMSNIEDMPHRLNLSSDFFGDTIIIFT